MDYFSHPIQTIPIHAGRGVFSAHSKRRAGPKAAPTLECGSTTTLFLLLLFYEESLLLTRKEKSNNGWRRSGDRATVSLAGRVSGLPRSTHIPLIHYPLPSQNLSRRFLFSRYFLQWGARRLSGDCMVEQHAGASASGAGEETSGKLR